MSARSHRLLFPGLLLLNSLLGRPGLAAPAVEVDNPAVQKTLKTLVKAIRFGKDDLAAAQLDVTAMSQALLAEDSQKFTAPQREDFDKTLGALLRKLSFSKGRELFKYLDAVLYGPATLEGTQAHCKSTVVVHRDLKKEELPIEWVLQRNGTAYRVVDLISGGERTTTAIRDEQIKPLLQQGGPAAVLEAMHKKLNEAP